MASIKGRQVRWYDPTTGRLRTKTLSNTAEAKKFAEERDTEARLYSDGYLDAEQLQRAEQRVTPICRLLRLYTEDLKDRRISDGHRRDLLGNLDRALTRIKVQDVRDLTKNRIRRFFRSLDDSGNGARSFNGYRAALLDFCKWLVDYDHLRENPVVVRPRDQRETARRPSRALTVAEADALVAATICPRRQALYTLRLHTGLRCREASRLRWADVDLDSQTLHLRADLTKNRKAEMMPLTDDVADLLLDLQRDALKAGCPIQPTDAVFGPPPDRRTWARDLDRANVKAKSPEGQADPKCLRRTFDSFLMLAGVDLIDVTLLMRHKPPAGMDLTLHRYGNADALLDRKRASVGRMVRWVEEQREADEVKAKGVAG